MMFWCTSSPRNKLRYISYLLQMCFFVVFFFGKQTYKSLAHLLNSGQKKNLVP